MALLTRLPTQPGRSVRARARTTRFGPLRAGHLDVLVNNAGVMHLGVVEETTIDEARAVLETNLFGVVRLTNAVLPHVGARRRGRIINVGSAAAWVGEPGEAFYASSKHALAGYAEALRHEVWPLGIHVTGRSQLTGWCTWSRYASSLRPASPSCPHSAGHI